MYIRMIGQSTRFVLGAASACALLACAEEAVSSRPPVVVQDVCDEAADYARRAAAADSNMQVRAALQRIADSKSRECSAKRSVSPAPSARPSSGAASATE